jgi:hypothetical protein
MSPRSWTKAILFGLATSLAVACGAADDTSPGQGAGLDSQGSLSAAEREGLAFTREEEKLARDVYAALEHHDPSFINIGASEQTHMDAVATLLTRYGVADPAAGMGAGEFTNPDLQALYDALVERGAPSRLDALAVGVEIEELDIHDIEALKQTATHQDILKTYDNLTRGSRNHLRTYYGKLVAAGGTYEPKHLDVAEFMAIVESPKEKGP